MTGTGVRPAAAVTGTGMRPAAVTGALIELGADFSVPAEPVRRGPRSRRPLAVAVVVLLALLLGGGTVSSHGPLRRLFTVPIGQEGQFLVRAGVLYVGDATTFSAYDMRSGAQRWRVDMGDLVRSFSLEPADGVLLGYLGDEADTVAAVELGTGAVLWRRPNTSVDPVPGSDVLVLRGELVSPTGTTSLQGVRARTGQVLWSMELPAFAHELVVTEPPAGASPQIAVFYDTSELVDATDGLGVAGSVGARTARQAEVIDAVSGRVLQQAALLGRGGQPLRPDDASAVAAVGDLLLVAADLGGAGYLLAYDLGTLALRWQVPSPGQVSLAQSCAPLLCVFGDQAMITIAGADGRVVATGQNWLYARQLTPDRLLAAPEGAGGEALIDGRLRVLAPLGLWAPASLNLPLVFSQPDRDSGDSWFGVLDPTGGRVVPVARVAGLVGACAADAGAVACHVTGDRLAVWSLR